MDPVQKLTKKQRKGIAFRSRKGKPISNTNAAVSAQDNPEGNDLPFMEDQDTVGLEGGGGEGKEEVVSSSASKNKGRDISGKAQDDGQTKNVNPKKRKRTDEKVEAEKVKKRRQVSAEEENREEGEEGGNAGDDKKNGTTNRFILFIGNLKYTTSREAIQDHFVKCDPPPTVRLLTPKASSGKTIVKSKGCAFLEFTHRNALQQALKLHQTTLDGRMINVELTAGGGGKGEKRLGKLKERNKQLLDQRKDRIKKTSDSKTIPTLPDRPQRFSTTSGIDQQPATKRTWTVTDIEEDGPTHRGGRKHKKEKRPRKPQATGVNAIPVG